PDAFDRIEGVHDPTVDGNVLRCVVVGSADALIKKAAQFTVERVSSSPPDLEAVFLAYYGESQASSAEGGDGDAG
ncbi:MAG: ABC transporter ATP-binding protein, partial [Coriobacteriia bacterium]|nr:ABC transporter ATP-binding protein [Coriobacteriia bacterium]